MKLGSVKPNDLVLVAPKQGGKYYARVLEHADGELRIKPTTHWGRGTCSAHEVIGIWHANKATAAHPELLP